MTLNERISMDFRDEITFEIAFESSESILFAKNNFRKQKWKYDFISKNIQKLNFSKQFSKKSKWGIHVGSKGGDVLSKWVWGDYNEVYPSKTTLWFGHGFFVKSSIFCF